MQVGFGIEINTVAAQPLERRINRTGMSGVRSVAIGHVGKLVGDVAGGIGEGER